MVISDGEVRDDPDFGGEAFEERRAVKCSVWQGRMACAPRARSMSSSSRVEPVVGIQARLVVALQAILHGDRKLARDEDSRFRGHVISTSGKEMERLQYPICAPLHGSPHLSDGETEKQ